MKHIIAAAAVSLLATTAVYAQTPNTATKPQATDSGVKATAPGTSAQTPGDTTQMRSSGATTGAQTAGAEANGITMGKTPSGTIRFSQADAGDLMTSKLVGVTVYNNENETIGEISDLTLDNGKTLSGVVLSVGGFLGLGERYVLIDPSSIALQDDNGTWKAYVNTNKDNLKSAPTFSYKDNKRS